MALAGLFTLQCSHPFFHYKNPGPLYRNDIFSIWGDVMTLLIKSSHSKSGRAQSSDQTSSIPPLRTLRKVRQAQGTVGSDWSVLEVISSCHRDPQGCSGFCPSKVPFFRFVLDAENLPLQLRKAFSRNTKLKRIGILVPAPKMNSSSKCYTILLHMALD